MHAVDFPEEVGSMSNHISVNRVIWAGAVERMHTTPHHEQDAPQCKQVHCVALVALLEQNFGCHIALSSFVCSVETTSISACKWCRETEIEDLYVKIVVKCNILRL